MPSSALKRPPLPITCMIALLWLATLPLQALDLANPPQGRFLEQWYELYLGKMKIGYGRSWFDRQGQEVHSTAEMRMRINRGIIAMDIATDLTNRETLNGDALGFSLTMRMSGEPIKTEGIIRNGKLHLTRTQLGISQKETLDWDASALMMWGALQAMMRENIAAGSHFSLPLYSPDLQASKAVNTQVEIVGEDSYTHRGREFKAIKTKQTLQVSPRGAPMVSDAWLDAASRLPLRTRLGVGGFDIDMFACTEKEALEAFIPPDIFTHSLIYCQQEIPRQARGVIIQLDFKGGLDAPFAFPESPNQRILENTETYARLAIRPEQVVDTDITTSEIYRATAEPWKQEYLKANTYINSEDPAVLALTADLEDPPERFDESAKAYTLGLKLQQIVNQHIDQKTLQVGFATASETARNATGDCTEHAVLLAALARAQRIPSRVVAGLVYLPEFQDQKNVFGFHMWTQLYIMDQWRDFDAALPQYHLSPCRIALSASSLEGDSLVDISLGVMDIIGRLNITIESVK